jgi:hypothetical protein
MQRNFLALALALASVIPACAQAADDSENSVVKLQATYVRQIKPAFNANSNPPLSLTAQREPNTYTLTATAFFGLRPWAGGEVYYNPEMSMGESMSGLSGLGGLSNGENQKGSGARPAFYNARFFLRQTWNLGEKTEPVESDFNRMAGRVSKDRVVLTVGKIALNDIFDDNAYAHDPRAQFLNWALMVNGAYDFAADARGYTAGISLEYFKSDWEFRCGRFMEPIESNGLALDEHLERHHGDQFEVVHNHEIDGLKGAVRLLAYRNRIITGNFLEAVAASPGSADLSTVRRLQDKTGFGINIDQQLTQDLGLFSRIGWSDGQSETYTFAEIDRTASLGVSLKGRPWGRENDVVGAGYVRNELSDAHRLFLANSGGGEFLGGWPQTDYQPEKIFESYYNANLAKAAWLTFDYQHITNPGYNPARGPVQIYSARLHFEY